MIKAVLFDFGGVILESPFDGFAKYEREAGLPIDTIRSLNITNPDTNAWARFERGELSVADFIELFETEASEVGVTVDGARVVRALKGDLRPAMVDLVVRCKQAYRLGLLTNNYVQPGTADVDTEVAEVIALFDQVVESSVVGVRKPELRFYEIACDLLEVRPEECVFLDDLGINLKPARAMGMKTIKVGDPSKAIADLEALIDLPG